jgi:hypothetical protein
MSDSIDRTQPIKSRFPERVEAVSPAHARKREEEEFVFEDKIDIAPGRHLQNVSDHLDLSLAMIRALVNDELPQEAVDALAGFAPLGDLSDALEHCDRVEQTGVDYIEWPNTLTLAQALERSAN